MWLTRLALRNPIFILMMSLMVLVLGAVAVDRLAVDLFPAITLPVVRVTTFYPGAGPADIEKSITQPIERVVAASPGADRVESTSKQGLSVVSVWFNYDVNLDNAQFEVQQRVEQILNTLPPGIQQPFIIKFDITNIPVVQVVVRGEGLDERQLYDLAYNTIEPQFERLEGVASANVGGGKTREIEIMTDRDKLRARNLGILDVVSAVKNTNLLLPSGDLRTGNLDYNVFTNTQVSSAKPLENVVVEPGNPALAGQSGGAVRIADVARVVDATADQSNIVRVNGERGVYIRVLKQPNANTIQVVDEVRKALGQLRGVPANVHCGISFDQSTYIRAAVQSLEHEAVQGAFFAIGVILLFLLSGRATAIVGIAIPLSIVATFVPLYFTGQTLNVFTLGGLALAVGRLVDDSIVELENIHRHLGIEKSRKTAVLHAAQEVAMPIFVSTITTIVVFFPVLFLKGVQRNLFLPFAMTISFALIVSFLVSRTVTPLLCFYIMRDHALSAARGVSGAIARAWDRLDAAYGRALRWMLGHRAALILVVFGAFCSSFLLVKRIGTTFFPDSDEGQIELKYRAPIGTRVERTQQLAERLEGTVDKALARPGGHGTYVSTSLDDVGLPQGRVAAFSQNTGPHTGDLRINLVPHDERDISDVTATERIRKALGDDYPGIQLFFFTGGIVKRILNFGSPAPIDVEIVGYDLDEAARYARTLREMMRNATDEDGKPLMTDVDVSREENYPELDVEVDREKAGMLGISEQQVAESVLATLSGSAQFAPVPFTDPKTGNEYFINVRADDASRSRPDDIDDVFVRTPSGGMIPLATLAKIKHSSGPVTITRKYLQRIVDVTANVAPGKDLGSASSATQKILDDHPAPDGFTATLGGQTAAQRAAFAGIGFAGLMALVLVYMVLASQFKSLVDPLVIMFCVPMGISGVLLMLFVTKTPLSVNSAMGVIMMVGIVVSNGVLLVDFANVLRRRGRPLLDAMVEAGQTRLRPILMTTLATIFGLLPMALGIGEGSETNLPLARAVIGGLTVSSIVTLFLIPSLYTLLDRFARRTQPDEEIA
jgi:hydrophobe/amphiphile efflux-1 (HAE1) family protein